jgi:hypothetical protein
VRRANGPKWSRSKYGRSSTNCGLVAAREQKIRSKTSQAGARNE